VSPLFPAASGAREESNKRLQMRWDATPLICGRFDTNAYPTTRRCQWKKHKLIEHWRIGEEPAFGKNASPSVKLNPSLCTIVFLGTLSSKTSLALVADVARLIAFQIQKHELFWKVKK
jgi:hypothetical protein